MAIRSYAVGSDNTVLRRDNHTGAWIDISPSFSSPAIRPRWNDVMAVPGVGDTVFIVGAISANTGIMKSTDAGVTWQLCGGTWASDITPGDQFYEIWVVDANVAWVIGDNGLAVRTTDGFNFFNPNPFSLISKPGSGAFQFTSAIHAIDANTAIVGGTPGISFTSDPTYIWKTINSGNTWTLLNTGSTYLTPIPPALRNNQTDSVVSLDTSILPAGTGYTPGSTIAVPTISSGLGTGLTIDIVTDVTGIVTLTSINDPGGNYAVGDTITIADGNNDLILTILNVNTGDSPGPVNGLWMSDDEATIVVGTTYTQQLSTDGGLTFNKVDPETPRSGKHLTWYPSHVAPQYFRHTGGPIHQIAESIDVGTSWALTRTFEGIIIEGAHFYSQLNGYYLVGNRILSTTDGGLTGSVIYTDPIDNLSLNAVWTEDDPEPCFIFTPCDELAKPTSWTGLELLSYIGSVVNAEFIDSVGNRIQVCGTITESNDPLLCSIAQPWSPSNVVIQEHVDCIDCVIPSTDVPCWNLISCDPDSYPDINYVTDSGLLAYEGLYIEFTNGQTYQVIATRQALFRSLQTTDLSPLTSAFQLGTDDHIITITSLIYQGVEYVPTPGPGFVLTNGNYAVSEFTELVGLTVGINTTENSIDNIPTYFNSVFTSVGVPLVAYGSDPDYCPEQEEVYKIQYPDATTFVMTYTVSNNLGVTENFVSVNLGNVTLHNGLDPTNSKFSEPTCNSRAICTGGIFTFDVSTAALRIACPTVVVATIGEKTAIIPRVGEPGFSFKNCDPDLAISIKTQFADSVYAEYKKIQYGIDTNCEFNLDRIDVKHQLLEFGKQYDPELCVSGIPVPFGCCPVPDNAIATLIVPVYTTCPAPINGVATLTV